MGKFIFQRFDSDGPVLITPAAYNDNRGYFLETFNEEDFLREVGPIKFVQENESCSYFGVVRGMHFQKGEFAQAKLVRVVKGRVQDVVVNCIPTSEKFGKVYSVRLTGVGREQFFVPRGFAHGFISLEHETIFNYKCDNFYNKESEMSFKYNSFNFDWSFPDKFMELSDKDKNAPDFKDIDFTKVWNF